jgi:hypothetical protein
VYADVASRWDCQNYYGVDLWFAGHRDGASGLANPNTDDINSIFPCPSYPGCRLTDFSLADYKNAVYWIQGQIDSNSVYKSDDTRFWVDVTAI